MGWLNRLGSAARSSSPRANFRLIHASAQRSICCRSWSGTLARTHSWVRRRRARRVVAERRGCTSVDVCGRYESSRRFQPFQPDQLRLSLVLVRFAPEAACAPMLRSSSLVMHRWIPSSTPSQKSCRPTSRACGFTARRRQPAAGPTRAWRMCSPLDISAPNWAQACLHFRPWQPRYRGSKIMSPLSSPIGRHWSRSALK